MLSVVVALRVVLSVVPWVALQVAPQAALEFLLRAALIIVLEVQEGLEQLWALM